MNTSLLVVPALAGYWVLSRTYITHFIVDRHVGYRFIFETAVVGLAILVVAQIIVVAAGWQDAELKWLPFEHAATLTVMVAIALGIPPVVNQFIPADMAAARRAVVDESRFGWLLENYAVTIAMKDIVSISRFDPEVYMAHVQDREEAEGGVGRPDS